MINTLLQKIQKHNPDKLAVQDRFGRHTYGDILAQSAYIYTQISEYSEHLNGKGEGIHPARIALLCEPNSNWLTSILAIWQTGYLAVPLCTVHPVSEWEYILEDTEAALIISDNYYSSKISQLALDKNIPLLSIRENLASKEEKSSFELNKTLNTNSEQGALIIYTSGSTGKPKGVITRQGQLMAQINTLITAWQWTEKDKIINVLPLHHIHGIVNVVLCAIWAGATLDMQNGFKESKVWDAFDSFTPSLFMAVPTIYSRLTKHYNQADSTTQLRYKNACSSFRLMVSGSAALPVSLLEKWKIISGQILLERYGMTEIGMALSNSYSSTRYSGKVGKALPGVLCRIVNEDGIKDSKPASIGELQVSGQNVFNEYWRKPEATAASFVDNKWFCTGDIVEIDEKGIYKIIGRNSVDIIKTGGYKISALEIEEVFILHNDIEQIAVVGLPDEEWGQIVCAGVVLRINTSTIDSEELRNWGKEKLAPYKVPVKWMVLNELPRNPLGKIVKPELLKLFNAN